MNLSSQTAVLPHEGAPLAWQDTLLFPSTAKSKYKQLIIKFPKNENSQFLEAKSHFRPTLNDFYFTFFHHLS